MQRYKQQLKLLLQGLQVLHVAPESDVVRFFN